MKNFRQIVVNAIHKLENTIISEARFIAWDGIGDIEKREATRKFQAAIDLKEKIQNRYLMQNVIFIDFKNKKRKAA